ncbi:MAG: sigma-70 family RNA polymerase sigma factor [Acidobacteriota bacterium]
MHEAAKQSESEVAAELVERIQAGDKEAESELVNRYSRGLLFMLRRQAGDPELASDLHQDTFQIVLVRLRRSGLRAPGKLGGFIHRTARNLFIGDYRKAARRKTESGLDHLPEASNNPGQLQGIVEQEEASLVRSLIDGLKSDRDRQLLFRFYIAEEEKESICADLGLDRLHFNRVIFRARQRFKESYERHQRRKKMELLR